MMHLDQPTRCTRAATASLRLKPPLIDAIQSRDALLQQSDRLAGPHTFSIITVCTMLTLGSRTFAQAQPGCYASTVMHSLFLCTMNLLGC